MSVNINSFKIFCEGLSAKVQIGNTLTVDQFNLFCNQAQMIKYVEDRDVFISNKEISFFLAPFLKNITTSVPLTGVLPYPSDLEFIAAIRSYYIPPNEPGIEVDVQDVRNADWGKIISSQLMQGTKEFPKYKWFTNDVRFSPKNIGIVMLDYFSTPVAPIWGYTTVNGRPVYDPATSIDFSFDSFATNSIAGIFLELVGTTLKDQELIAFSKDMQQLSKTTL